MAVRALVPTPKTFADLTKAVRATLITGQAGVDRAYLETYRNTGLLIDAHILLFKERAGYGEQVIPRLAHSLGVGDRLLYRCLRFVRTYPILSRGTELGWSHYRLLIEVADQSERRTLETEARQNHWTAPELERRVRALNAINITPVTDATGGGNAATHAPLVPQRGTPGVYRVAKVDDRRVVDLGFACYFDLNEEQADDFKDGALVRLDASGRITAAEGATKADLFNYRVELIRVVDGDTLWVRIYVRPRQWVKQKLRLRGLDCPELSTPEGQTAKRFVDALVARTTAVTINTTKPDKYDRYLADVFLIGPFSEASPLEEIYLNNALLENGQAVRKDAWEFGDWEPELLK
ncbi:MAG: thermonuclease family protein [Opitutaceae bacterium]|nr:thermonuclease family protein [Opitutaceae bacterium]